MVPLVALEMVRSPIAGPLTPAPTELWRLAVVAAVRNPSKEAVIATFVPLSTAVAEPEPASSARVLASAGIAERRALKVSLVWAESESPSPLQAIASTAITTREFSTIPAFHSISKWLATFDSGQDANCFNLVVMLPDIMPPLTNATKTSPAGFPYAEFEARIARRDFRGMTKDVLPTPCMIVDEALFLRNVKFMADQTKAAGIALRPHVKVHKSVDVAKVQLAHGAIGLTCATIAEAELMSRSGLQNVMWTKQPASRNAIERAIALSIEDPTFLFVIDDPLVFHWVQQAAEAADAQVRVLVSVYAGMTRQGIENGQPALELAQKIASSKNMTFEGIMAYSGVAAHTKTFENRREQSAKDLAGPRMTVELIQKSGIPVNIFSGGSTGTYNMDHENGLTELEAGSYVFMDERYFIIGGKDDPATFTDFAGALTVLATVDSKHHPNQATIDYGNKAGVRPTDKVKGMPRLMVGSQGAEYGLLSWKDGDQEIQLGDRVEIYCTVLDDSTSYYERYYVARGEQIVDAWPIMGRDSGRSGAAWR